MVGLSRPIKEDWLGKTAELVSRGLDEKAALSELRTFLSNEIKSEINLRKTRAILVNTWVRSAAAEPAVWERAVAAYGEEHSNKLALHWSMLLLSYPVFSDVCGLIGKVCSVQDAFTTAWLKEKLYEVWGERSTLLYSCEKILQTLKNLGAIEKEETGGYRIIKRKVSDGGTIKVMLLALLALQKKAYYNVSEISNPPLFFPFEYNVTLELLHNSPEFRLSSFGGKTVVTSEVGIKK
jgi:hypothetical protein